MTIAKYVKIQVEFKPGKVNSYRLLGYANRRLREEDFADDQVDAGDIGAGHTVTALYEIVPSDSAPAPRVTADRLKYQASERRTLASPEWLTVKLRYKAPTGDRSKLLALPFQADPPAWDQASPDLLFASAVALFAEKLRASETGRSVPWHRIAELALPGAAHDPHGQRAEFLELIGLAARKNPDRQQDDPDLPAGHAGQSGTVEASPADED